MSGDFETLEINQPKIKYLKPEDNTKFKFFFELLFIQTKNQIKSFFLKFLRLF